MNIYQTEGKCTACPRHSDRRGDHAISCGYEGERIARHDHLRNALYNTCSQACLGPTREVRDLVVGTDARPADLFLPNWSGGQDTALDITVVNPLQVAMVQQAAVTPGFALSKSYNRKVAESIKSDFVLDQTGREAALNDTDVCYQHEATLLQNQHNVECNVNSNINTPTHSLISVSTKKI